MVEKKAETAMKDLVISIVGIIIAIILAVLALGIAWWAAGAFGISDAYGYAKAAALIAVAIIIGPTIAAFATKKYF
jgi:uncharacterized membrane protein YwzB